MEFSVSSLGTRLCRKCFRPCFQFSDLARTSLSWSTRDWELVPNFSQTPSDAIKMYSSEALSLYTYLISGMLITICSLYIFFLFDLKWKSPNVLDTFRLPFILPRCMCPPALLILSFYIELSGLWSYDKLTASPFRQRTDLESPIFAMYIFYGVRSKMLAVDPTSSPKQLLFLEF